jgi:hypothetical protein
LFLAMHVVVIKDDIQYFGWNGITALQYTEYNYLLYIAVFLTGVERHITYVCIIF